MTRTVEKKFNWNCFKGAHPMCSLGGKKNMLTSKIYPGYGDHGRRNSADSGLASRISEADNQPPQFLWRFFYSQT